MSLKDLSKKIYQSHAKAIDFRFVSASHIVFLGSLNIFLIDIGNDKVESKVKVKVQTDFLLVHPMFDVESFPVFFTMTNEGNIWVTDFKDLGYKGNIERLSNYKIVQQIRPVKADN